MTANPIQDQIDAAASDAANRLRLVTERMEGYALANFGVVAKAVMDRWFSEGGGPGEQCMCTHVADAPQVVYGAAAFPGVIMCSDCFQALWTAYVALLDRLQKGRPCDGCHQWADMGKTGVMSCGPMLLTVSMCMMCASVEHATEQK